MSDCLGSIRRPKHIGGRITPVQPVFVMWMGTQQTTKPKNQKPKKNQEKKKKKNFERELRKRRENGSSVRKDRYQLNRKEKG